MGPIRRKPIPEKLFTQIKIYGGEFAANYLRKLKLTATKRRLKAYDYKLRAIKLALCYFEGLVIV
jgi:hypothetical protein